MNRMFNFVILLLLAAANIATAFAGQSYRGKYANVLRHYSKHASDSLKYKAAMFLIDNMDGHVSPEGTAMEKYVWRIKTMEKATGIRRLQAEWYSALKEGSVANVPDSAVVSDSFLVNNIDAAFDAWEKAPWKEEVTFGLFCRYILPYRVSDEHIGEEWRSALRRQYAPLIDGVTDIRRAFAVVKDSVFKTVVLSNKYCPYTLDPITCNRIGRAECGQRCVLLVAVLRSLGIPAVIDGTPMWADYSNKGHAWVAMVGGHGDTYTVYEDDDTAKQFNPIDASQFLSRYKIKPEDKCPYDVKTEKTSVKVYRICYERCNKVEACDPKILASPFIMDVSRQYGLATDITLEADGDTPVYLCAYLSGIDWAPVAKAMPESGEVTFRSVGKGSVCVPVRVDGGRRHYLSCPFLVGENGIEKMFVPSATDRQTVTIDRKYPLCSYITDTWAFMRGGTFEGSMTDTFDDADTLAMIATMPYGMTDLDVSSVKMYRYLRYHAPKVNRSSLAELQFYTTDETGGRRLLSGNHLADGVDMSKVDNAFDGNPATSCKGLQVGYTMGIDLGEGKESRVTNIIFAPSTDLNFVERDHLYELYYFDTEWHLVGRVYSKGEKLTFDGVPEGALLLLKDKTKGVEERIFEYSADRQIWH